MRLRSAVRAGLLVVGLAGPGATGHSDAADDLPPGAVRRLGTSDLRPGERITGLAVVAGGKQVVTATAGGLTLWNLATGRPVGRAGLPKADPPSAKADRDVFASRTRLFPAPDGKSVILLWRFGTYRYPVPFTGRPPDALPRLADDRLSGPTGLALPDPGEAAVALSTRGTLHFLRPGAAGWAVVGGRVTPAVAQGQLSRPEIAGGGRVVATGGGDGRVRVWAYDAAAGVREVGGVASEPVGRLAVSADGRRVAAVGRTAPRDRVARVWDAATLRELARWPLPGQGGGNEVVLSPDGATVAVVDTPRIGDIGLYDAATGTPGRVLDTGGDMAVELAFLPDGSGIVATGMAGTIHYWKIPGGEPARPIQGHRAAVRAVTFLPGGGVATGGEDGFVIVYDPVGKESHRFEAHGFAENTAFNHRLNALVASPDGGRLYTAGYEGAVRAWDAATGRKLAECQVSTPPDRAVVLAVSGDGKRVAAGLVTSGVRILLADRLEEQARFGLDKSSSGIGFAARGLLVVASDFAEATAVWALNPPAEVRRVTTLRERPIRPRVSGELPVSLSVSPDGTLFTGPSDGGGPDGTGPTLVVWTVAGGDRLFRLDLGGEPALCAAFLADGKRVAVGSADGSVRVFDLATGAVRHTFRGHRGPVLCLAASADGKQLVSGGLDTTAVVWAVP